MNTFSTLALLLAMAPLTIAAYDRHRSSTCKCDSMNFFKYNGMKLKSNSRDIENTDYVHAFGLHNSGFNSVSQIY